MTTDMRKFFAFFVTALAVGFATAQPPMGPPPPGMMPPGMMPPGAENRPRKTPQERIEHITKELGLTEKQAEKFAPVYLAYQTEIERIRKELKNLMDGYEGKELNEKLATRKVMDQLNAEADIVACKKEYLRVFKDHLNAEQITKIFTIERRGNRPPFPPQGSPQGGPHGFPGAPRE